MVLPHTARWKAASDKEIANFEKHGVLELAPVTSVPIGHKVVGPRYLFKIKVDSAYKGRLVEQEFS